MTLGTQLREARESKKISLEAVSKKTRIAPKYLEALEQDRFDIFPSQVYAKGFIRAYAKVVGLDPQALTRLFKEQAGPEERSAASLNMEAEMERNFGWRMGSQKPAVIHKEGEDQEFQPETEPDTGDHRPRDAFMGRSRRTLGSRKVMTYLVNGVIFILALGLLGWGLVWGIRALGRIHLGNPTTEATLGTEGSFRAPRVMDKYQHLVLKCLDKSWVLVTMDDGQSSSEADMDQGEVKTYKAVKNFKIRLGNAGGVDVQINGKSLGVLGATGEVLEITLPQGTTSSSDDSANNG